MNQKIQELLSKGIAEVGLQVPEEQLDKLLAFLSLLKKWNATFNLSGVSDIESMVSLHLLDSLAINPYLKGDTFVDFGSGGGLPGIPLAILNPKKKFVLIDSNGKKTRFLFQVRTELCLDNVSVENCRIEHYQNKQQIDMVMCRAFSTLEDAVNKLQPLLSGNCSLLAMKGIYPEEEISNLPSGFEVSMITKLEVPGISSQRHVLEVKKNHV
jgi:16S rRNA (guanine527-N7)-methyltransferase